MSDRYQNFQELTLHEKEGVDFRIDYKLRIPGILILAPHGGNIEPGTSEITKAIAEDDLSYYCFEGLKETGNADLHITSTKFDEPIALKMAAKAANILTIHGCKPKEESPILIGGLDLKRKTILLHNLLGKNHEAAIASTRLPGLDPNNICNRGITKMGIQLELRKDFSEFLLKEEKQLLVFTNIIRGFLRANYNIL